MGIFVLAAAKGRPGVSTTAAALTLSWPISTGRRVLLVDADVSGGGLLSAYQRYGLGDGRGLLAWATGRNPGLDLVGQVHSLDRDGERLVLPGIRDCAAAATVGQRWAELVEALEALQQEQDLDVVVDMGRLGSRHEAELLIDAADLMILVLRSNFESVTVTQGATSYLANGLGSRRTVALLVGERHPYSGREIARALDLEVAARLPEDRRGAERLASAPTPDWLRARSALARAALVLPVKLLAAVAAAADV